MPRLPLVRPWTEGDLIELRSLWVAGVPAAKIARRLRRGESAVKTKARQIGLPARFEFPRRKRYVAPAGPTSQTPTGGVRGTRSSAG